MSLAEHTTVAAGRRSLLESVLHLVLPLGLFHFVVSHLHGDNLDLVLASIHVSLDCNLVAFVALQGLGIAHRPTLLVLVVECLSVSGVRALRSVRL